MTQAEKDVLSGIVQLVQDLTVKVDTLERALIERGSLVDGERGRYAPDYYAAASRDTMIVRGQIAGLP